MPARASCAGGQEEACEIYVLKRGTPAKSGVSLGAELCVAASGQGGGQSARADGMKRGGRLRMPISNELSDRNFVTKIARYHRVVDVPNSMTVLTDMLPLSLAMSAAGVLVLLDAL